MGSDDVNFGRDKAGRFGQYLHNIIYQEWTRTSADGERLPVQTLDKAKLGKYARVLLADADAGPDEEGDSPIEEGWVHLDAPALCRAALLQDVVEVLLVNPPQLELLDRATFRPRRLYSSISGAARPPHLCQLGSVNRATIF